MNARRSHWSEYTSTLALALHLHRASLELVEAAHSGDADVILKQAHQMTRMIARLELDFASATLAELAASLSPESEPTAATLTAPERRECRPISAEMAGELFVDRHSRMQAVRVLCEALEISIPWELREVPG